jgi:type IV pilus assembly protein PilF
MLAAIALAATLLAGCSRLTFVKASTDRGDYTRIAPEIDVREDPNERGRLLALEQLAAAGESLRDGRLDVAAKQARAALDNDPSSAEAHTVLALVAQRQGQSDEAGKHYARAAELSPRHGIALNNYGAWLCGNGRVRESLPLFDRALADPAYATPAAALANAGSCAIKAGDGQRAERYLRLALQYDPTNPVALGGMASYSYGIGDYLQARAFSERRLAAAPATRDALQLASQIEQKLGDTKAAARYVRRMGNEFPPNAGSPGG